MNAACSRYKAKLSTMRFNPRVVIFNGEIALPGEFPHMAALGYLNDADGYDFQT